MKNFKKLALTATAAMIATSAWATDIIVVSHGQANDPFWAIVKNGADLAGEHTGANVEYRAPETFDMVAMSQLIDAAVNQEPDGIVVSIPDADALGPSIQKAVDAGIPVISMNSGSDVSKGLGALLHVGQEEYAAGEAAGEALAEGGSNAICVNHEVGNVALDQRCAGFEAGFGGTVTVLPTGNDPAEIKSKVSAAIASDESIDTVIALGASLAGEPSVEAVQESGRDIQVASFDLSANFLQMVLDGKAEFGIDQQPYLQGYLPVVFLSLNADYGTVPGGNVPSGPNLITASKAAQVMELSAQGIR